MKNRKKGFTLVELIIAMVVIAIAVVGTLEFFIFCQKNFISTAETKFIAANYARETMEEKYWLPSISLTDTPAGTPVEDPLPPEAGLAMTREYEISTINPGTAYSYKLIKVTVKDWTRNPPAWPL